VSIVEPEYANLTVQASDTAFIAIAEFDVDVLFDGHSVLHGASVDQRPYVFEVAGLQPGKPLELVVSAKGYVTQRRNIVLAPGGNQANFILGKRGAAYYEQGGTLVPFRKRDTRYVVIIPQPGASQSAATVSQLNAFLATKQLVQSPAQAAGPQRQTGAPKRSRTRRRTERPAWHRELVLAELSVPATAASQNNAIVELVEQLRAHPEQGRAAILLNQREAGASYFTGEIIVWFSELPQGDEMQRFGRSHALRVVRAEGSVVVFEMEVPSADFPDLIAQIRKDPRVKHAEARIEHTIEVDTRVVPTDFLFPMQWDHQIIQTPEAWFVLQGAAGANNAFGGNGIVLAIADPQGVEVAQPDLTGNVNGVAKLVASYDFSTLTAAITLAGDHGTACATTSTGVANRPAVGNPAVNEGAAGVAGTCPVVLVRITGPTQDQMYRWYCGYTEPNPGQLARSVDVTSNSYGSPTPISAAERWFLDDASDFGRAGRGLVMFYSAGNANTTIVSQRSFAAYPRTLCVTATTLTAGGTLEAKTPYSNFGPEAGICSLSDSTALGAPTLHNPPASWGAVCGTVTAPVAATLAGLVAQGNIPGFPQITGGNTVQQTFAAPGPAVGTVNLNMSGNVAPFAGLTAVLVDAPGAVNAEGLQLTAVTGPANQLSVRYSTNIPPIAPGTQKPHGAGVNVIGGNADFTTEFGGTSYATPVVAGVAALILTARNTLSWVEVRDILRTTSRKVNVGETNASGLWRDPAVAAPGNTVLNAAQTNVRAKSPAAVTALAANAAAPSNALRHLNQAQSTLQLTNGAGFEIGDAIRISDGVNTEFHVIEAKAGNSITIDALRRNFGTSPVTTLHAGAVKPVHSDFYGFGRVNARLAVQAAINYNHADRDLMIRNHLADTGLVDIDPAANPIHSPDIWIRNQADPPLPAPPYNQAGPHQNPAVGNNRFIYARIKNIGQRSANLDAWVHFYVALSDHGFPPVDPIVNPAPGIRTPFLFPGDPGNANAGIVSRTWNDIQANDISPAATGIRSGALNVYHVRDATTPLVFNPPVLAGTISASDPNNVNTGVTVVRVRWNQVELPPANTNLAIYLLVYVSPVDGRRQGMQAGRHNNMSYREIAFADFRLLDNTGAAPLPSSVTVDAFGTPVVTQFRVRVRQLIGSFLSERVQVDITRTNDNGSTDRAVMRHDGANWRLLDQGGNAVTWAHLAPPVVSGTANAAAAAQTDITFAGDFSCALQHQKVAFRAVIHSARPGNMWVPIAEQSFDVQVMADAPEVFTSATDPNPPQPDSFSFTDFNLLAAQSAAQSFGPLDANRFRVTSVFTASSAPKAFAVCPGVVMVQRVDANRVNLVLRPLRPVGLDMTPVKYYIYRGLRLDHFLDTADNSRVRPQAGAPAFVARLWPIHIAQNPGPPPFSSVALGHEPANQPDNDVIDRYFFASGGTTQYALAKAGEWLGDFVHTANNEFGFEIVLEEGTAQPTFGNIRQATHIIDVSALPAGNDAERFAKRLAQEAVLNYLDPAAFYGMHYDGVVRISPNGILKDNQIVANVVNKFATRNRVYIDIRNENGNSYNFYRNYQGPGGQPDTGRNIRLGTASNALTPAEYGIQGWPIHFFNPAQATADPKNSVFIALRQDDNLKPVLYIEHGEPNSTTINKRFIDETLLLTPPAVTQPWTNEVEFRVPNTGSGTKPAIAWVLKLHYSRIIDPATVFPPTVVQTKKTLDNLFGPIDLTPLWAGGQPVRWIAAQDRKYVDGEQRFAQMMERGVAFEGTAASGRVIFFAALLDQHKNILDGFVPRRGVTGGTSVAGSFLQTARRFDQYRLEFGVFMDGTTPVTELRFTPGSTSDPAMISGVLFLGISAAEYMRLQGLAGLDNRYPRTIFFEELPGFIIGFRKFKLGLQGLKVDGTFDKVMPPAGQEIFVYTTNSLSFYSKDFSSGEPLPTTYQRNVEESVGVMNLEFSGTANFAIHSVLQGANGEFRVANNLQQLIAPNGRFQVTGNPNNNGTYNATTVAFNAGSGVTSLRVANVAGASASGSLQLLPRRIAEHFLDLDSAAPISGTNPLKSIVEDFRLAVNAVPNDENAQAALQGHVNNFGLQALARARVTVRDNNHANADDRPLYWARLAMQAILKSHAFLVQNVRERDILVRSLENRTRGLDPAPSFAAAGASRRVLLLAFDPLLVRPNQPNNNSHQSSPSALAALYLHANAVIANMFIQCVILPVRFDDFDAGLVDTLIDAYLQGPNQAQMILSLSQGIDLNFHVDRFATRVRALNIADNTNVMGQPAFHYELNAAQTQLVRLAGDATLPRFLETTLPVANMVPGSLMSEPASGARVAKSVLFNQRFTPAGAAAPQGIENAQSAFSAVVPPVNTEVQSGSGGNFLPNELFYRIAWRRVQRNSPVKTGHLQVPRLQSDTAGPNPLHDTVRVRYYLDTVVQILTDALPGI
jgi:hypothetical protein